MRACTPSVEAERRQAGQSQGSRISRLLVRHSLWWRTEPVCAFTTPPSCAQLGAVLVQPPSCACPMVRAGARRASVLGWGIWSRDRPSPRSSCHPAHLHHPQATSSRAGEPQPAPMVAILCSATAAAGKAQTVRAPTAQQKVRVPGAGRNLGARNGPAHREGTRFTGGHRAQLGEPNPLRAIWPSLRALRTILAPKDAGRAREALHPSLAAARRARRHGGCSRRPPPCPRPRLQRP